MSISAFSCIVDALTCPPGDLQCNYDGKHNCMPPEWICDGEADCGDNSDEEPQACEAKGE